MKDASSCTPVGGCRVRLWIRRPYSTLDRQRLGLGKTPSRGFWNYSFSEGSDRLTRLGCLGAGDVFGLRMFRGKGCFGAGDVWG